MNRSGIKRGLAISAVSALALTGISTTAPAFAAPIPTVELVSQFGGAPTGSIVFDGVNQTIHLVANGNAGVSQVVFAVRPAGSLTYTDIATVSGTNGEFTFEWAPAAAVYNTTVNLRATALGSVGTPVDTATRDVAISTTAPSVDIANATGSSVGVYAVPDGSGNKYGIVSGTTSDLLGAPDLSSVSGGAGSTAADIFGTPASGVRSFSGLVDFNGDTIPTAVGATALVGALDGSDDVEAVKLYAQTLSDETATLDAASVPVGSTATATVKVVDQTGKPIGGALVYQVGGPSAQTDSQGKAVFAGLDPSPTPYEFVADVNGNGTYEPGTDFKRTVTVSSYTPAANTLTATSAKGAVADYDELAADNFKVAVKDQNGAAFTSGPVSYKWTVVPFDGSPTETESGTAVPVAGTAQIPAPTSGTSGTATLQTWLEQDGTPGLTAGDAIKSTPLVVKLGQAKVIWTDGNVAQRPLGTTKTFTGKLALEDGTGLPSRTVPVSYDPGANSVIAAQGVQPGGVTRNSDTSATVVVDGSGNFGIALSDPAGGSYEASDLTANGADFTSSTEEVDFMDVTPAFVINDGYSSISIDGDTRTPGRPVNLDQIDVQNAAHQSLTDVPVTITVNHGFLTPYAADGTFNTLTPAAGNQVEGGKIGDWKNDGTSKTFVTGDGGVGGGTRGAVVHAIGVAIGRDAGFDVDGAVTTTVTSTAGAASDSGNTISWDSANPLNPGDLTLVPSASNSSKILPKARTGFDVHFDLVATDQFGNRVDQLARITDNTIPSDSTAGSSGNDVSAQFLSDGSAVDAYAGSAVDQTVTATWETEGLGAVTNLWHFTAPSTWSDVNGVVQKVASSTVNWYNLDLANSTYTLVHNGASTVAPGSTVLLGYKAVDQFGQPLAGYEVRFFRSGPDTLQDGNGSATAFTNSAGTASYLYQGTKAGTATVTAALYSGGNLVPSSQRTDKVVFAATALKTVTATLGGKNNARGNDVLSVNVTGGNASGATVTFYRKVNGVFRKIGTATLGANNSVRRTFFDARKGSVSVYRAVVSRTSRTKADTSNSKYLR